MSSSVHRRSALHPRGDERNFKVRLSNLIASDTAVLVSVAETRGAWWILEQPASSWTFKLPVLLGVVAGTGAQR
eukprot:2076012-Alexandrium_andersonii.AAC.1